MNNDTHMTRCEEIAVSFETEPIVPFAWLNELVKLREIGAPAIIAGGAVRDLLLRRTHRDIDIWTLAGSEPSVRKLAEAEGWELVADFGTYGELGDGLVIWKYLLDGEEYNVIVTRFETWDQVVGRFDFGVSRAYIETPEGTNVNIRVYPEFTTDALAQVFKVRHNHGCKRSRNRYERLLLRYPGWTFEEPAEDFLHTADPYDNL